MVQMSCEGCNGMGQIINNPCTSCNGGGTLYSTTKETITVPKGVDTGTNLKMTGKGHCGEERAPPGDLIISIKVKPHIYFKRDGANINTDLPITLS